jgi:hypothetical protein
MKTAGFYQGAADAMGVALYLYPDGSVTNSRKVGVEPTATIEPHERWKPPVIMTSVSRSGSAALCPADERGLGGYADRSASPCCPVSLHSDRSPRCA